MIWKYLFMSKSTALTQTTLGTTNSATSQAPRNHRWGTWRPVPRSASQGDEGEQDRDAQVRDVEEDRGGGSVGESAPRSTRRRSGTTPRRPGGMPPATTYGRARIDRCEEQRRVAQRRARLPRPGGHHEQPHDEVGRREGVELERREERGQHAGQQHAGRSSTQARAPRAGPRPRAPAGRSVVARWGRNPVPKTEAIRKNGQPSAHELSYGFWVISATMSVWPARTSAPSRSQPMPPPAHDEDRRDRGDPPAAGQHDRQRPHDQRQHPGHQGTRQEEDRDDRDVRRDSGDGAVEVREPVVASTAHRRSTAPRVGSCHGRCCCRWRRGPASRSSSSRRTPCRRASHASRWP